jgi:tRNA(fMet)-specific endonuclease VapC
LAYLIDTNIAIDACNADEAVLKKFLEHDGAVMLSALSFAELQRGLYKYSTHTALRRTQLEILLHHIPVLPFDAAAAEAYGRIIARCGWIKGRDYDRMIAGHALSTASVLVTNNVSDFGDIPELKIENWAKG